MSPDIEEFRRIILEDLRSKFNISISDPLSCPLRSPIENVSVHLLRVKISSEKIKRIHFWLDRYDWQLTRQPKNHGELWYLAPMTFLSIEVGYHATRRVLLSSIMLKGLLPGSPERQNDSERLDCFGNIYICEKLGHPRDAGVYGSYSAHWWRDELSKKTESDISDWVVLEINGLSSYRLHRDMCSDSGVIVGGVDCIPPELITLIYEDQS